MRRQGGSARRLAAYNRAVNLRQFQASAPPGVRYQAAPGGRMAAAAPGAMAAGMEGRPEWPSSSGGASYGIAGLAGFAGLEMHQAGAMAASYAAAQSGGVPWNAASQMGNMGAAIGAGVLGTLGAIIGGPAGLAIGAGMGAVGGGAIGGYFGAGISGDQSLWAQQRLTYAQTGNLYTAPQGAAASGSLAFLPNAMMGGDAIGARAALLGIGQLGGILGTPTGAMTMPGVAAGLVTRFGSPLMPDGTPNPAYSSAAGALSPMLNDPTSLGMEWALAAGPNAALMGNGGIMGAMAAFGPDATRRGLQATGNSGNVSRFAGLYAADTVAKLTAAAGGSVAGAMDADAAIAGTTGSRTGIMAALGEAGTAWGREADALGDRASLWRGAARTDPYAADVYAGLRGEQQGALAQAAQRRLGAATAGPDASWTSRTAGMQTAEQIGLMDPFFPFIPPSARQGLIGQYTSRLSQIDDQSAGNPAAAAALAPERSQLMIERAGETNAMRQGIMGEVWTQMAGAPSGVGAWGLSAQSLGALQHAVPGAPVGLGGSGRLGQGDVHETNRLLERILLALEGGRSGSGGGSTGGGGSPFSFAPRRANQTVGH